MAAEDDLLSCVLAELFAWSCIFILNVSMKNKATTGSLSSTLGSFLGNSSPVYWEKDAK